MKNQLFARLVQKAIGQEDADVPGIVEGLRRGDVEATVVTMAGLQVGDILYTNVEVHAFPDGSFLAIAENQQGNDINFITGETSELLAGAVSVH